ncbi:hypothetical protein P7C71_g4362, partial [Lecanoromycetidae sp. Uapishka_2]
MYDNTIRLRNYICDTHITEEEAQKKFDEGHSSKWNVKDVLDRHEDCYDETMSISTSFLSTCRQIYDEAKSIPYSKNTFSFNDVLYLERFSTLLSFAKAKSYLVIQSLHLDIYWLSHSEIDQWVKAITQVTDLYTNMKNINIDLTQSNLITSMPHLSPSEAVRPYEEKQTKLLECLGQLDKLDIKTATFIIFDDEMYSRRDILSRWTLEKRQRKAKEVIDRILHIKE